MCVCVCGHECVYVCIGYTIVCVCYANYKCVCVQSLDVYLFVTDEETNT